MISINLSIKKNYILVQKKYFESASFVVFLCFHLLCDQRYDDYYGYLMKSHKAIDIDTKNDWEHALKLFNIKGIKKL